MTVRVVSAPPAMNSPVSCIIVIGSMPASAHTEMRSSAGQPLRSAAISSSSGLNSMMADITPMAASGSREHRVGAHEPLRPRLDVLPAVLGEPEEVGGEPRRQLGGEVVHHLELARVGDGVEQLVDPALRGTPRPAAPPAA